MVRDSKKAAAGEIGDYEEARCLFADPHRYYENKIAKGTKKLQRDMADRAKRGGGDRMDERRLALFNKMKREEGFDGDDPMRSRTRLVR